jgi:putative endonuclease
LFVAFATNKRRSNLPALIYNKVIFMGQYYIYIMTNKNHTVFYIGMTNDLVRRVYEHKEKSQKGFTKRYRLTKLAYYEIAETAITAITREKQLKGGSRQDKIDLIKQMNPNWLDLYDQIV